MSSHSSSKYSTDDTLAAANAATNAIAAAVGSLNTANDEHDSSASAVVRRSSPGAGAIVASSGFNSATPFSDSQDGDVDGDGDGDGSAVQDNRAPYPATRLQFVSLLVFALLFYTGVIAIALATSQYIYARCGSVWFICCWCACVSCESNLFSSASSFVLLFHTTCSCSSYLL